MIYADSNVIIRLIEGDAATRTPLESRLQPYRGTPRFLKTSLLSRLECRVMPLRLNNTSLLSVYEAFFLSVDVELLELNPTIIEKATDLRAVLKIKTPDALHLASAILCGAKSFLTGDKLLTRCSEIPVEVL